MIAVSGTLSDARASVSQLVFPEPGSKYAGMRIPSARTWSRALSQTTKTSEHAMERPTEPIDNIPAFPWLERKRGNWHSERRSRCRNQEPGEIANGRDQSTRRR